MNAYVKNSYMYRIYTHICFIPKCYNYLGGFFRDEKFMHRKCLVLLLHVRSTNSFSISSENVSQILSHTWGQLSFEWTWHSTVCMQNWVNQSWISLSFFNGRLPTSTQSNDRTCSRTYRLPRRDELGGSRCCDCPSPRLKSPREKQIVTLLIGLLFSCPQLLLKGTEK